MNNPPIESGPVLNDAQVVPHRHNDGIFRYTGKSSQLDEIEDTLNHLVTSHSLVPATRDTDCDGEFQIHALSNLAAFNVRYGCDLGVSFHPDENEDLLAFVMSLKGGGQFHTGREEWEVSHRKGVIIQKGLPATLHYQKDCETTALIMNRHRISEHCGKLLGREIEQPVDFATQFPLDHASGQSWLRLLDYATAELTQSQSLIRYLPAARQQLEQTILTALLLGHTHSYTDALLRPQTAAAPYYVKRAEAYIEAHFSAPLSLADIAAQAGVSARSLQSGFQSFRGMTPMAFLRSVRLQHVHRALLKADPTSSSVTAIAMNCGFNHLGEFATAYKRTFGVLPKETLWKGAKA